MIYGLFIMLLFPQEKEKVNNTSYFTINITYNNNYTSKLYFLNEQI